MITNFSTLADIFSPSDAKDSAVILPEEDHTCIYSSIIEQVRLLACAIGDSPVPPGEVVAVVLPNGLEYLVSFLGVVRARRVAAPLNPAYKPEEFRFYLEDAGARAVIAPPGVHPVREVAREMGLPVWTPYRDRFNMVRLEGENLPASAEVERDQPTPDDVALFLHTSGTTSRPKGVPLTHGNLTASIGNIVDHYQLNCSDVSMLVMPLFHVHGLIGVTLSTFHAGGAVIAPSRFSAGAFWPTVQNYRANWYSAAPTIHQVLLMRADADGAPAKSGFRFIRSCSSALAAATMAQLEQRFDAPVVEAYAMTEASHQMTSNPLPPGVRKPGSVGRGTKVDVAIMDEAGNLLSADTPGEVVIRGPNVTKGYHNNPEANQSGFTNGWFRTGDRGVMGGDGYLTLIGRIKELINRGGEKISPLEIDAALLAHPAVAEAATFGAPHEKYGEEVHAAVVLKSDATAEDLQAHCRDRLADFKVPKVVHLVKELPKGPTGKVQRRYVAAAMLKQVE